jgi:hypothetical protein
MSFLAPIARSAATAAGSKLIQKGSKEVTKKKMSKKKKAAIAVGGIYAGRQILGGEDAEPTAQNTGILTSDAAAGAIELANNQVGTAGNVGLTGLPIGTQIAQGGTAGFSKGSGALAFAALVPAERAQLILRLGQIPGLYAKDQAPTPDFVQRMISGKDIVPRSADFAALEAVQYIAEWSGTPVNNTVNKLIAQPEFARQFFNRGTGAAKAVSSSAALGAELNDKFLDLFETKADPALVKAYTKEINALELKGTLSAQQKEDILLKYVQKKAADQFNLSQTGMVPGVIDKGSLGRTVRNIRVAYEENGIPINEKQIYNKAVQSLRSPEAYKNVIDGVMMQAGTVMPAFKEYFSQGKTAREVLSPWINTRSQVLGIPADQIKVTDMYEVGSGPAPISIQDYKKQLYRSPEFKKTDAFKERSLGDLQTLLRAFNIG